MAGVEETVVHRNSDAATQASVNSTTDSILSSKSATSRCVLCGGDITVSDPDELGRLNVFARLSTASDVIILNKLSSVAGCSAAELHARGGHVCPSCHGRLLQLHGLETSVERERALLSELYRRSCTPVPTPAAASDPPAPAPPPGDSLLLVNDVEVRLQGGQVTAVPLTNTRRRQLLRQARSAERRFECKVCGKRFRAFSHRVEHMLIHVNETPWSCELCPKTFRTKSALTAHQRVHTPAEGRFTCAVCDRRLADAASLRAHTRTHEPGKPFTCDTCGHEFARRKDHAVHVRQHTGERPHACPECPLTFVARSRLNRHRLLHRDKQFACGCGRAFRRRYELQRHGKGCGQPAGQQAAVTYLPTLVLPEPAPTLYYQVVTPVAPPLPPPPLPTVEEADQAAAAEGGAAVQQGPAPEPTGHPPVITY